METLTLAAVLLDPRGTITGMHGSLERFALTGSLVGRPWHEAFARWQTAPPLPDVPADHPVRLRAALPDGEPVTVEVLRHSTGQAPGSVILVRGEHDMGIPPALQQLCGVGEISGSVAHEINNALTIVCGWLEILRAEMPEGTPHRDTIELVVGESRRIGKLTRNLQQVARGGDETPHDVDLKALLEEVAELVGHEMQKARVEFQARLDADLPMVHGATGALKQALLNLLINARQAVEDGGRVTLEATRRNGCVDVSVEDNGAGIPVELQALVFRPFFTTKRNGTGLGLPIARRIIEAHGGALRLESRPGRGARFSFSLPARAAP